MVEPEENISMKKDVKLLNYQMDSKNDQYLDSDKAVREYIDRLAVAEQENEFLKNKLNKFYSQLSDHDKITANLAKKTEEYEKLRRKFNDYRSSVNSEVKKVEDKLKKELKDKDLQLEALAQKIKTYQDMEETFEKQSKLYKQIEKENKQVKEEAKHYVNKREIKLQMKFENLKTKMIDNIEETEQKVKDLHFDHLDVTTKLTLLQNQQLLIELEFQNQKLKELEKINDSLKKQNFELKKDIEVHKEVELSLASKNKKLAYKRVLESEPTPTTEMGVKQSRKNLFERKIKQLEAKLSKKSEELFHLKGNLSNLQSKLHRYRGKYSNLLSLFDTCISEINGRIEQSGSQNILINVEEMEKEQIEQIDLETRLNYTMLLAKLVIPLVSAEDVRDSGIEGIKFTNFVVRTKRNKMELKLPELIHSMEKPSPKIATRFRII